MRRSARINLLLGLSGLLWAPIVLADPCGSQPFRATVDVSEVLTPTSVPGVSDAVLTGTGRGAHLGRLGFAATEVIDFRQFFRPDLYPAPRALVTDGRLTLTAADGDQITATYEGYGVPDPDRPGFFNGFATATLTGGTGRFRCATGTVPLVLDINTATLTEVIKFDGSADLYCDGAGR